MYGTLFVLWFLTPFCACINLGFIAKPTEDQLQREKHAADRLKWIAEQKRKDAQRERERERERLREKERDKGREGRGRDYEREREHERELEKERKERERMKEYEQRMKDYKPDVNIEYTDEFGKVMTPKEVIIMSNLTREPRNVSKKKRIHLNHLFYLHIGVPSTFSQIPW